VIEKAPGESQGLFCILFINMQEWERYLDGLMDWSYRQSLHPRTQKVIDIVVEGGLRVYLLPKWLKYQMVKRKTEAFFERGRLYQLSPINDPALRDMALYALEDMELAQEEATRGDYTPFLLKKAPRRLYEKEVFMLVEVKRYRFDYSLLKVLAGDQVSGIILYGKAAMYPWEVFTDITE